MAPASDGRRLWHQIKSKVRVPKPGSGRSEISVIDRSGTYLAKRILPAKSENWNSEVIIDTPNGRVESQHP